MAKRKGKPLTIYFDKVLAERLYFTSQERRVPKATLVRFAVERLLNQLSTGQLELPLGL
jgi:predicted DNA-binding protein